MPIQKATILPNGVSGNFWRTRGIYVSPDAKQVQAIMNLYANEAAYLSGAPAIDQREYILSGNNNPLGFVAMRALLEPGLIASQSDFVSGTIVV